MKQASFSLLVVAGASLVSGVFAQQNPYGQCGGMTWTGATTCTSGWVCTYSNDYYSQCLPAPSTTAAPTSTTKPPSTTTAPTSTTSASTSTTKASTSTSTSSQPTSTSNPALTAEWQTAISKAKTYLAKFTNQNKIDLVTGVGWMNGKCLGNTKAITSVNFPGLCLQDAPVGIRSTDKNSVFPAGLNIAATFNRDLMKQRGAALGAEFKGKGVHVALGPMMNIARVPTAGRNWEGFGGDPYLSGEGAYQTIVGMQSSGVQACAKHYINNEQELNRETSSSNVDDRTQHEVYLAPFLKSVQAGVASVMCSYNKINGDWACENDKMLNQILKTELGFPGYVMSDWAATHSTLSANKGLDMTMPGDVTFGSGTSYFGSALLAAVSSGQVSQARLDDMATRILAGWYLLGQDTNYPAMTLDSWNLSGGGHVDVQGDHKTLIRQIGAASTVVLKNNGILPLKKPKTIGIIGNDAGPGNGPNAYGDRAGLNGVLAVGWGSGTAEFPYLTTPLDAIKSRSATDGTTVTSTLSDSDLNSATSVATGKDVAIVFIAADSGEGYLTVEGNVGDRNDLNAWHSGDALVAAVAKANTKTIVVIHAVGPINMEAWADNANVAAIVFAGLPGQEAGNSLADVLYGDVNPSGRLPFTIGKKLTDYPAQINSASAFSYSEGLLVDYKWFDAKSIAPRYPFGFGLSYTTFSYSGLAISGSVSAATGPTGLGSSLDPWLHNAVITVSFKVTNTGTISGTEIPQLYVAPPASANSAPQHLRGFTNVSLAAGASTTVSLTLSRYNLAVWSTTANAWVVPAGTHGITIGTSSRDPKLTGSVTA